MKNLFDSLKHHWMSLQARERMVLMVGGVIVALILFYALILFPWHRALNEMTQRLPALRQDVVWMRVHGEALANGEIKNQAPQYRGAEQSLLSVIEQTASRTKVRDTIQQLVPDNNGAEVRVVLEDAQFNLWLQWIDVLYKQYGVDISQLTVEKEDERPNIAEIRVTFSR